MYSLPYYRSLCQQSMQACLPGMLFLLSHLFSYYLTIYLGGPPLFLSPIIEWIIWDPKAFIFRAHDSILSIIAIVYALFQGDRAGIKTLLQAHLNVALLTEALKHLVGRQRPNGRDYKSFPSGHTSSAFCAAAFIHHRYGLLTAAPFYIGASTIGCVRVYHQAHYPTDVIGGASLALLISYPLIIKKNREIKPDSFSPAPSSPVHISLK